MLSLILLPNLCALLVFIGAFRPVARRGGPHSDAWFYGWFFLIPHCAALIIAGLTHQHPVAVALLGVWSLECVGFCFLRAAASAPNNKESFLLSFELSAPILAQSALVICNVQSVWPRVICTLLLMTASIHLWRKKSARSRARVYIGWGLAVSAICLAPITAFAPGLALSIVHALLFLGSAALYWNSASRTTPGVLTAVSGLSLWGISYPLQFLLDAAQIQSPYLVAVWQFPTYIVAYGMILTLIEKHVRDTEGLALQDPLTGLPNRRLYEDRLEQALAVAPKTGAMLACIVIDLDGFKQTNDTLGHAAGDGLLQAVAARLSWHLTPGDTLARTGGDEFAAILPRLQSLEHLRFTVGAMMSATSAPVVFGEHSIQVGLSIGIALYPDSAQDAESLRRRADAAMYEAKRSGGNRFAYADGPPDEVARLLAGVPSNIRRFPRVDIQIPDRRSLDRKSLSRRVQNL